MRQYRVCVQYRRWVIISNLLINEPPLQVLPSLAKEIGLNEAIVLQQLHYWIQKSEHLIEGRRWVYNSYPEWQKQFPFWHIDTIKRIITKLENSQLVVSGNFNKMKMDKTKWYSINYQRIGQLTPTMSATCTDEKGSMHRPIPETTTETTTDIKPSLSKVFDEGSNEFILSTELKNHILANNPKARIPTNLNKWAADFDKIIRIDKREVELVRDVMVFSQRDSFWMANILSPSKLREKFDTLYLKMRRDHPMQPNQPSPPQVRKRTETEIEMDRLIAEMKKDGQL